MKNTDVTDGRNRRSKEQRRLGFRYENRCSGLRQLNQCFDPHQGIRSTRPGFFSR